LSLRVCLWPKDIAGISLPMSTGAMLAAGRTEVGDRQVADILFDFRSAELQKSLFGLWTFCRRNSLDISKANFPRTVSVVRMTTCPPVPLDPIFSVAVGTGVKAQLTACIRARISARRRAPVVSKSLSWPVRLQAYAEVVPVYGTVWRQG